MSSMRRRAGATGDAPEVANDGRKGSESSTEVPKAVISSERGLRLPLMLLLAARLFAALTSMIADCDETFNYWEPMHFITFGRGFQTWEYSPKYALRSYLFLLPHAGASYVFAALQGRPAAFFFTRSLQGVVAAAIETFFVTAISQRFGVALGRSTAVLLALSPGVFVASVAFLPSSIAMLQVCAIWALWLRGNHSAAIFIGASTVIVVWPFACLLFIPLGLHALFVQPGRSLAVAIASFLFWSLLSLIVDSFFYGRTVLPAFEIAKYNVLQRKDHGGSELYGVEPWHFYLVNGFLNLNIALPAALSLPIVALLHIRPAARHGWMQFRHAVIVSGFSSGSILHVSGYCAAAFLWLAFFSAIPHKEERFLAPAYPILIFAAAASLHGIVLFLSAVCDSLFPRGLARRAVAITQLAFPLFLLVAILLSLSRIAAVSTGYSAPVTIYQALNDELAAFRQERSPESAHVCIGGEWYRFMSSFFLPDHRDHLSYVRFGPTGLLPAEFNATLGTAGIPLHMNDRNREEPSRYIDPALCDFLIDLTVSEAQADIADLRRQRWDVVKELPFLDSSQSRQPWRAFYVPGVSIHKNIYGSYRLLRRGQAEKLEAS